MSVIISKGKSHGIKGYPIRMEYPDFWYLLRSLDVGNPKNKTYEVILQDELVYMRIPPQTLWQRFKKWWKDVTTPIESEEANVVIKSLQPGGRACRVREPMRKGDTDAQ